jgi:hypothetical protein
MVLLKTLNKRGQLMSVATKIGIQISAKLGGEIWAVPIPVSADRNDLRQAAFRLSLVEKLDDYRY